MTKFSLSREQRRRLMSGEAPRISGDGECPVEPGFVYNLSIRVSLKVVRVLRQKSGGWTLRYEVTDRRDPIRNLRRTPTVNFDTWAEADDYGIPPEASPKALRDAAEESGYTSRPTSLSDAGEAVSAEVQRAFSKQAQNEASNQATINRLRRERYELERRLERARQDAELREVDISSPLRVIERQIAKIERRVYEGKAA